MSGNFFGGGGSSGGGSPSSPSSGTLINFRPPTVSDGQTIFTLPTVPTDSASVEIIINGVAHSTLDSPNTVTISGSTLTWTNSLFEISSADEVRIKYN